MRWMRLTVVMAAVLGLLATPAGAGARSTVAAVAPTVYPRVTASAAPESWNGSCSPSPTFTFTASITVLFTPETVRYRWISSDFSTGQVEEVHFTALGPRSKTVQTTRITGAVGTHWRAVEVISPRRSLSNMASYHVQCT
ncbi:hypothetical protein [Nonomuraea endophytica]|uniref:hypothetical protein n=1 Tax=Nonomuraea endophytica TaxID=714136 RepID=UPI0037C5440B